MVTREGSPRQAVATTAGRTPAQWSALFFGVVFLLLGAAGFIPALRTGGPMGFMGPNSQALLMDLFEVSVLKNVIYLALGLVGVLVSTTTASARGYLLGAAVVMLGLFVYGQFMTPTHPANLLPVNGADNWLHVALGFGLVCLAAVTSRRAQAEVPAG